MDSQSYIIPYFYHGGDYMKKILCTILCVVLLLFVAGCGSTKAAPELKLSVENNRESYLYFPGSVLGKNLNPGMDYQYVGNVQIQVGRESLPLEKAIRDGQVTIQQMYAKACKDAEENSCTLTRLSQNGVTNNLFCYPDFQINIVDDLLEYDGRDIPVAYLAVSSSEQTPNTIDGWDSQRKSPRVKEDWGLSFEAAFSDSSLSVTVHQSGGMQQGMLTVENAAIIDQYPFALSDQDGNVRLTQLEGAPLTMDGESRMEINLAEFLGQEPEKGTYTLRICIEDHVLSEQTPKHQSSQYYSIPFTVQ